MAPSAPSSPSSFPYSSPKPETTPGASPSASTSLEFWGGAQPPLAPLLPYGGGTATREDHHTVMDALLSFMGTLSSATTFRDAVEACKVGGVGGKAKKVDTCYGYREFAAWSWRDEFGVLDQGNDGSVDPGVGGGLKLGGVGDWVWIAWWSLRLQVSFRPSFGEKIGALGSWDQKYLYLKFELLHDEPANFCRLQCWATSLSESGFEAEISGFRRTDLLGSLPGLSGRSLSRRSWVVIREYRLYLGMFYVLAAKHRWHLDGITPSWLKVDLCLLCGIIYQRSLVDDPSQAWLLPHRYGWPNRAADCQRVQLEGISQSPEEAVQTAIAEYASYLLDLASSWSWLI